MSRRSRASSRGLLCDSMSFGPSHARLDPDETLVMLFDKGFWVTGHRTMKRKG